MSHNLIKIPAFDKQSECCHAVIETPKGSHHKFDYDPDLACFQLKKTLPEGMTFPLDFGFIPSTLADDGDPVDVLVVLDFPAAMGALIEVRLIGGIEAEQRKKTENGKKTTGLSRWPSTVERSPMSSLSKAWRRTRWTS